MFLDSVLGERIGSFSLGAYIWFTKSSGLLFNSLQIENTRCLAKISFL